MFGQHPTLTAPYQAFLPTLSRAGIALAVLLGLWAGFLLPDPYALQGLAAVSSKTASKNRAAHGRGLTQSKVQLVPTAPTALGTTAASSPTPTAPSTSAPTPVQQLAWMETAVFGHPYDDDTVPHRLERLEDMIFGETQTARPESARLADLDRTLSARKKLLPGSGLDEAAANATPPTMPQAPAAVTQQPTPQAAPPTSIATRTATAATAPKASSTVGQDPYPAVGVIEQKMTGRTFSDLPVETRLGTLETRIFGQPQPGDIASRVDTLRLIVLGDSQGGMGNTMPPSQGTAGNPAYFPGILPRAQPGQIAPQDTQGFPQATLPPNNTPNIQTPEDMSNALIKLEQTLLKQTFPGDNTATRLARLEQKVFQQPAPPDVSDQDRVERLIAVASAQHDSTPAGVFGGGGGMPTTTNDMLRALLPLVPMVVLMFI